MEQQRVIVYTQPGCSSCRSVERFLKQKRIAFEVRDIRDATALKEFLRFGFLQTPVTVIGGKAYAGFSRSVLEHVLAEHQDGLVVPRADPPGHHTDS